MLNSQFVGDRVNPSPMAEHRQFKERQTIEKYYENWQAGNSKLGPLSCRIKTYRDRNETETDNNYLSSRAQKSPKTDCPQRQNPSSSGQKSSLVRWEERDTERSIRRQQTTQEERTLAWVRWHFQENYFGCYTEVDLQKTRSTTQEVNHRSVEEVMRELEITHYPYCKTSEEVAAKFGNGPKLN